MSTDNLVLCILVWQSLLLFGWPIWTHTPDYLAISGEITSNDFKWMNFERVFFLSSGACSWFRNGRTWIVVWSECYVFGPWIAHFGSIVVSHIGPGVGLSSRGLASAQHRRYEYHFIVIPTYCPRVMTHIAFEHGHSEFSHSQWWFQVCKRL